MNINTFNFHNRLLFVSVFIVSSVLQANSSTILVNNKSEFDAAVGGAVAGDTIQLKNGTWTNVVLEFFADGVLNNPIILTAETAGEVILTGSSRLEIYGKYLEVHNLDFKDGATSGDAVVSFRRSSSQLAENCRLTNCRILNYNPATDDIDYKWVSIFGKNNRVDHCTFSGKNNEGTLLVVWLNGNPNYHLIDHNYFSDIPRLNRNGGETIRIGTSTNSMTESRTIVEHNVFEKCDGELEIISNKSGFNIYRYNTFRNNDGVLTLRHGNDCEVYGNFFFGASGKSCGGVRIIGERHKVYNNYFQDLEGSSTRAAISMMNGVPNSPLYRYFQVKDAEVVHNTIVSCRQAFAFGVGKSQELSLPPLNCLIANNVADKVTRDDGISYVDTPINVIYSANIFNYNNLDVSDTGILILDPVLILTGGLWRTERGGPTEDGSTSTFNYVLEDMDGQARDVNPDIGSDEISQAIVTNFPLVKSDVGVNWDGGSANVLNAKRIEPKVYTNNGKLYISELPADHAPYQFEIANTLYQLIDTKYLNGGKHALDLQHLKGIYVVRIMGVGSEYFITTVQF